MSLDKLQKTGREQCLILVKALPHVGQKQGETVCCAGVTRDLLWRRQFPIHFRRLRDNKFKRWDWIEYDWIKPSDDRRTESRRVQEDKMVVLEPMKPADRARFLAPVIKRSTDEAAAANQSLALIRPVEPVFTWKRKTAVEIRSEKATYSAAASQGALFDESLSALEPCPYQFKFEYRTEDGKSHRHTCDDWETSAMFYNFESEMGEDRALSQMEETFTHKYPQKGMVFAMGTHSRRPEQWLLVGVIRLDKVEQAEFKF